VRVVEPGTPPVTVAAHVMALAQDSPLRRAHLARARGAGAPDDLDLVATSLLTHLETGDEEPASAPAPAPAPVPTDADDAPWQASARSAICRRRDFTAA
jgi:hypothetical protein